MERAVRPFFGGLSDMLFRHNSDISCALLCFVGRNRNERRLLGYIYQLLTVDIEVPNLEAAGSNPAGRAKKDKGSRRGPFSFSAPTGSNLCDATRRVRTDERSEDRPKAHLAGRANFSLLDQAVSASGSNCLFL